MYTETYSFQLLCMFQYTNTHTRRTRGVKCYYKIAAKVQECSGGHIHVHNSSMCALRAPGQQVLPRGSCNLSTRNFTADAFALRLLLVPASCTLNQELLKAEGHSPACGVHENRAHTPPAHSCEGSERTPGTNSPRGKSPEPCQ